MKQLTSTLLTYGVTAALAGIGIILLSINIDGMAIKFCGMILTMPAISAIALIPGKLIPSIWNSNKLKSHEQKIITVICR